MSEKSAGNQSVLAVSCELKPEELVFGASRRDPKLKIGAQTLVCNRLVPMLTGCGFSKWKSQFTTGKRIFR